MIIDLILDRYDGDAYDPKEFYDAVMDYEEGTKYPISRALDGGEEEDVKRELCAYIDREYNPNIKKFINAVEWLKGDDGKDYSKEIDIMAEKKESIGKQADDKITFKLTEIPKELNHVYRACKKRFWCEPVLNNMVETSDHGVYNFSGKYGSYLELLVVVEHTPDKYFVTVKGLDETDGYEYVELGKGEADTIQKATADAMAGVDKNMLPLAIKIRRATKGESKTSEASPRKWRADPADRGVGGKWGPADTYNINRDSREEALAFFKEAMRHSEGSERNRYTNIVWGLEDGLDVVDDHYWESKKSEAENPKDVIGDELPYGMMQYRDEDTKEWLPILVSLNYNDRGWFYEGLVPTDNLGNFGYDEFSRGFLKTCKSGADKCDQELVNSMKKFFADASMDIDKMPTKEVTDLTAYIPKGMEYIGQE